MKQTNKKVTIEDYQNAVKVIKTYREQRIQELKEIESVEFEIKNSPFTPDADVRDFLNVVICRALCYIGVYPNSSYEVWAVSKLNGFSLSLLINRKGIGLGHIEEFKRFCFLAGITLKP